MEVRSIRLTKKFLIPSSGYLNTDDVTALWRGIRAGSLADTGYGPLHQSGEHGSAWNVKALRPRSTSAARS